MHANGAKLDHNLGKSDCLPMTRVYLGFGSNLRSPQRQLRLGIKALRQLPQTRVVRVASFLNNEAFGRKKQPRFCNTVVAIDTKLTPQNLLRLCQRIEQQQGRYRHIKWGARTLDIDILLYGQLTMNTRHLTIPHPGLWIRDFVYLPLLEIAPEQMA